MSSRIPSMTSSQRRVCRWLERMLLLVAACAAVYAVGVWGQARVADAASLRMERSRAAVRLQDATKAPASQSDVIGRIQIPDLHLSAPITDGIGKVELIRGVGHIPGTAVAGGLGTMALAGHRDTFFRALQSASPGMEIRVSDSTGAYRYRVDSTQIVTPEQVEVLETGSNPALVLITCYPFHYIGAAPKRFIVHAKLLSAAPDNEG